jgi:2-iminobutanoate/2-iminopropanoate deaminase
MTQYFNNVSYFSETPRFSQGAAAGEFIFISVDARRSDGKIGMPASPEAQAQTCFSHLLSALRAADRSQADIVSLSVFLPAYDSAAAVGKTLREQFGATGPAVNFVGVCALDGDCLVRMDAVATINPDRASITLDDLPRSIGAGCHGVRVGDFFFLSGVDAANSDGEMTEPIAIKTQTTAVLRRIERILGAQRLGLGNLCRTFMFMPGTKYRPGYGEARKRVYDGIFAEDAFPPNSGIYIKSLGKDILLRSQAIAYRGAQQIVTSPKVRLAPGSFSQSVRVGDWLLLAGQDAVTFDRVVECEGSLAGQTEATLRHTKDIVEAAGGTLDDIVKTTVYLTEGTDRREFAIAYEKFFASNGRTQPMPSGLTVVVEELSPRCLVEIDSVAYLGK